MALLFIVPLLFFGVRAQPEEHAAIQPEQKKMIGDVNDTCPIAVLNLDVVPVRADDICSHPLPLGLRIDLRLLVEVLEV